jgi:GrpB-like predicted nucleotidyltransferase (UPF0157 family)
MQDDPHNEVSVIDYDPAWIAIYESERDQIVAALSTIEPALLLIEHVGSTAVPGLAAKPIVDIMVCYERLPEIDRVASALAEIGYAYVSKPEFTESYFFRRGESLDNTIHLHVTTITSEFGLQMLRFRDALRASPNLAADYAAFKRGLADQYPHDRPSYTLAKGPFITGVIGTQRGG